VSAGDAALGPGSENGAQMSLSADDERQIADLVVRYADAVSSADPARWRDTWADQSQWHLRTRTIEGREAIVAAWTQFLPTYDAVVQMVTRGWVSGTDGEARGRWLVLEIFRKVDAGHDMMQVTSYTDRYVRPEGRWLFAERRIAVVYRREMPPGEFLPWVSIPDGVSPPGISPVSAEADRGVPVEHPGAP